MLSVFSILGWLRLPAQCVICNHITNGSSWANVLFLWAVNILVLMFSSCLPFPICSFFSESSKNWGDLPNLLSLLMFHPVLKTIHVTGGQNESGRGGARGRGHRWELWSWKLNGTQTRHLQALGCWICDKRNDTVGRTSQNVSESFRVWKRLLRQ